MKTISLLLVAMLASAADFSGANYGRTNYFGTGVYNNIRAGGGGYSHYSAGRALLYNRGGYRHSYTPQHSYYTPYNSERRRARDAEARLHNMQEMELFRLNNEITDLKKSNKRIRRSRVKDLKEEIKYLRRPKKHIQIIIKDYE